MVAKYRTLTYHVYSGDENVDHLNSQRLLNCMVFQVGGRVYFDRQKVVKVMIFVMVN